MARARERLGVARKALGTLQALPLGEDVSDIVQDAAIQRFEYTFEATWKAAQAYLSEVEGLEAASPRAAIRTSFQVGVLSEGETRRALSMVDDRNLSVHTYNEALAEAIFARLAGHANLLVGWLGNMERSLEQHAEL